jgi:signal recognition particle subunit SRP14
MEAYILLRNDVCDTNLLIGTRLIYLVSYNNISAPSTPTKVADDPLWDTHPPSPLPILIRATDGKTQSKDGKKNKQKVKLSTVVQPDDLEAFYARYAEVCKAGMQSLKKRDRSKRKKTQKKKKAPAEEKK